MCDIHWIKSAVAEDNDAWIQSHPDAVLSDLRQHLEIAATQCSAIAVERGEQPIVGAMSVPEPLASEIALAPVDGISFQDRADTLQCLVEIAKDLERIVGGGYSLMRIKLEVADPHCHMTT